MIKSKTEVEFTNKNGVVILTRKYNVTKLISKPLKNMFGVSYYAKGNKGSKSEICKDTPYKTAYSHFRRIIERLTDTKNPNKITKIIKE